MFQYVWFDKSKYTGHQGKSLPQGYINYHDIEAMGLVYWAEHCTECAVPVCYNNCSNWEARIDRKCRRFVYGIKRTRARESYGATLYLKKWAKLESVFFNRTLKPSQVQLLDGVNYYLSNCVKYVSKMLRFLSPTMKISGFLEYAKNKIFAKIGKKACLSHFLVSCFLHGEESCSLSLEIYNGVVLVRQAIDLKPGYNQIVIDLGDYKQQITKNTRVRIFGAEDTSCEATFFFLDFVKLNDTGRMKLLPKNEQPAEKVKCVVWDLDNTVWDGILIESDTQTLKLRPGVAETMQWLDDRGIIQCICSKNDEHMAETVLKRLGIYDYFVCRSINWIPKSLNINEMANEININVNTFAFVDDSASERNEVSNHLPSVRVFKETDIAEFPQLPEFDVPITEDSKNRRKMYQINKSRNDYKAKSNLNHLDFLRQCELTAVVSHINTEEQKKRSYELLLRTNQLNLSGKRYEEKEFDDLLAQHAEDIYILSLKDNFGTYGQSLFMFVKPQQECICIAEFALSCRIAGKYVESAIMNWLTTKYGDKDVVLVGKNNKKNTLLINTLKGIGFEQIKQADETELVLAHKRTSAFENCDIVTIDDNTTR